MRKCYGCNEVKPLEDFTSDKAKRLGKSYQCRPCAQEYGKRWRAAHSTERRRNWRRWVYDNNIVYTERLRERNYRDKYGIGVKDYDSMFEQQEGKCALCGRLPGKGGRLRVDHDHQTGRVRGLLCIPCNTILGRVEDMGWLRKVAVYLRVGA